jgi:hypothetical protein
VEKEYQKHYACCKDITAEMKKHFILKNQVKKRSPDPDPYSGGKQNR